MSTSSTYAKCGMLRLASLSRCAITRRTPMILISSTSPGPPRCSPPSPVCARGVLRMCVEICFRDAAIGTRAEDLRFRSMFASRARRLIDGDVSTSCGVGACSGAIALCAGAFAPSCGFVARTGAIGAAGAAAASALQAVWPRRSHRRPLRTRSTSCRPARDRPALRSSTRTVPVTGDGISMFALSVITSTMTSSSSRDCRL